MPEYEVRELEVGLINPSSFTQLLYNQLHLIHSELEYDINTCVWVDWITAIQEYIFPGNKQWQLHFASSTCFTDAVCFLSLINTSLKICCDSSVNNFFVSFLNKGKREKRPLTRQDQHCKYIDILDFWTCIKLHIAAGNSSAWHLTVCTIENSCPHIHCPHDCGVSMQNVHIQMKMGESICRKLAF